jgi:predicted Zn-dependent protease
MVGGEARRHATGDRIVGCTITAESLSDQALLHELGHCFGLHHTNEDSTSLMYWIQGGASGSPTVTPADKANLTRLYDHG